MRIGVIASLAHRTPPRDYGPWELVASILAEGYVARGHEVTLFATEDSITSGRLVGTLPTGYEEDRGLDAKVGEALHLGRAFEHANEFDVVHNHFDFLPLSYSRLVETPLVTTIHGFSSERIVPVYRAYDDRVHYVAISDADRHPDLHYAATVHHGIDLAAFPYAARPGEYLLYFARIHPHKGTHHAIEIARRAGLPLKLAGIVQDAGYFESAVRPHLQDPGVDYLGPVGPAERGALLGGAAALLHPIEFAEPFGLSVAESMATGTPVIATALGSMPELIADGRTGFLVSPEQVVEESVRAVGRLGEIDRAVCHDEAVRRFGRDRMIEDYLRLFERIVAGQLSPTDS